MTLARRLHPLARAALLAVSAVSFFVVAFVAYAHVVSVHDARLMMSSPRETHFVSASSFANQFRANVLGGASYVVDGNALTVCAPPGIASADFVGDEMRLVEARISLRFRSPGSGAFDVLVGVDAPGELTHTISLEISRFGDRCTVRLVGDAASLGPRNEGDRVLAESPADVCDADWHRMEIRFAPDLARVIASVDDEFVFAPRVRWDENTVIRPTFGIHGTANDSGIEVQVSEMRVDPIRVDFSATDVDDDFRGKIIDPFWRAERGDRALVDSKIATGSRGLVITGRALTTEPNVLAHQLMSPQFTLGSFQASADIDVTALDAATFHLQIENEPGPAWRFVEVGFLSKGDGLLVPFGSGHFEEDGQSRFNPTHEAAQGLGRVSITFDYDAQTRRARGSFSGRPFFDEHVDLPPRAIVHFSMGANVDADGIVDLAVRSLHIDHTR
jgi:hypothetical protein